MYVLIIGFGNMGCRHTQSILNGFPNASVTVVEPNKDVFDQNLKKIGVDKDQISYYSDYKIVNKKFDLCIVATSSKPRYQILKDLFNKEINKFLVEKVVFQSENQFDEIISICHKKNIKVYCNFVNRYFKNYKMIKSYLNSKKLNMIVTGGRFGLGCNAIHYIDLFEFLTMRKANLVESMLSEDPRGNKRGNDFKEFTGQLLFNTSCHDSLYITSESAKIGGNEIILNYSNNLDILNEETLNHIQFYKESGIQCKKFNMRYTSELTDEIIQDIFNDECILPTVSETKNSHIEMFKAFNGVLNLNKNDLTPIT